MDTNFKRNGLMAGIDFTRQKVVNLILEVSDVLWMRIQRNAWKTRCLLHHLKNTLKINPFDRKPISSTHGRSEYSRFFLLVVYSVVKDFFLLGTSDDYIHKNIHVHVYGHSSHIFPNVMGPEVEMCQEVDRFSCVPW